MRFVPMNLSIGNRTILQTNSRKAFQLSPVTGTEVLLEEGKVTYAATACDRLDTAYLTDDLE